MVYTCSGQGRHVVVWRMVAAAVMVVWSVSFAGIVKNPPLKVQGMGWGGPSTAYSTEGGYLSDGSTYRLKSAGEMFYFTWDRGGYAYTLADGNASISLRIKSTTVKDWTSSTTNPPRARYGICVREYVLENGGLFSGARSAQLMVDHEKFWSGHPVPRTSLVSWYWRSQQGDNPGGIRTNQIYTDQQYDGACPGFDKIEDLYLKIKVENYRIYYYAKYGASAPWTELKTDNSYENSCSSTGPNEKVTPKFYTRKIALGVFMSSGSQTAVEEVQFDNIEVECENCSPSPSEDVFNPRPETTAGTILAKRIKNPPLAVQAMGKEISQWQNGATATGRYLDDRTSYLMRADGRAFYWAWDRGGYAYMVVQGNAMITARFQAADFAASDCRNDFRAQFAPQYGLCAREYVPLDPPEKRMPPPYGASTPYPGGILKSNARAASIYCDHHWYNATSGQSLVQWLFRMTPTDDLTDAGEKKGALYDGEAKGFARRDDLYLRLLVKDKKVKYYARYGAAGEFTEVKPDNARVTPMNATANVATIPYLSTDKVAVGVYLSTGGGSVTGRKYCSTNCHQGTCNYYTVPHEVVFDNIEIECDNCSVSVPSTESVSTIAARRWFAAISGGSLHLTGPGLSNTPLRVTLQDLGGKAVYSWSGLAGRASTAEGLRLPGGLAGGMYVCGVRVGDKGQFALPTAIGVGPR